jgi:hypothetical protein
MQIIRHRVNTIEELSEIPTAWGVEADLRDQGADIIMTHDPHTSGPSWGDWLNAYRHGTLIANIKCEGIEKTIIGDLEARGIDDYFLLDMSLPFLVKYARTGFRNMAIRFSEYEPLDLARQFAGLVNWVWVDCFTGLPLNTESHAFLKSNFKICLVSPELHGRSVSEINTYRGLLTEMPVDAVCTKRPDLWAVG